MSLTRMHENRSNPIYRRSSGGGELNDIQAVTKDCPREDCSISGGNSGMSTCMGWSPSYDKHGNRTSRGDPNIFTTSLMCSKCGASWRLSTQYGKTTITPVAPRLAATQSIGDGERGMIFYGKTFAEKSREAKGRKYDDIDDDLRKANKEIARLKAELAANKESKGII